TRFGSSDAPLTLSRSPALGIFASESDEGRRLRPDGVRGPLRDGVGGAVAQEAGRLQAAENQGARCRASQRHQSHGCAPPQRAGGAGGAGAYEVRKPEEYFSDIEDIKVPGEMLKLAEHIVERSVVPSMRPVERRSAGAFVDRDRAAVAQHMRC